MPYVRSMSTLGRLRLPVWTLGALGPPPHRGMLRLRWSRETSDPGHIPARARIVRRPSFFSFLVFAMSYEETKTRHF